MDDDPRVSNSGIRLMVTDGEFSPDYDYRFTVVVRDNRDIGRKPVAYTQVIKIADEPIPIISISCDKYCDSRSVHPGDRWVLHVHCESCRVYPVPVYYHWEISRTGGSPGEFDWAASTGAGVNEGKELTTIVVLPNVLMRGAEYTVAVKAKYQPETEEDYKSFRALV